jgi:hypothetical protein
MSEIENQETDLGESEESEEQDSAQEQEQAALEAKKQQAIVEAEAKARKTGWVPEPEFKGDPKNWRPAEEWNERGDEYIPFIKAELKETKEQLTGLEGENKSLKTKIEKMTTVQDKFVEDFYDKSISELEEQELKAVEEGDTETFQRIREQKDKIEKPEPVAEPEPGDQLDQEHPVFKQWKTDNPWFETDPRMARYAVMVGNELAEAKDPTAVPGREAEFGAKVTAEVKAAFPDKFTNPKQNRSDMDEPTIRGGEPSETGNGAKGWDDLPADAKQHCKKLMAEHEGYTVEEYIKHYPFDEG